MLNALWVSATGMSAQQLNLDTISNNLANVNTTAFKSSRAQFADLYAQQVGAGDGSGEASATVSAGLGTRNIAVQREFTPGVIENTGNPLDVAIQGDGFLQVSRPDGSLAYTRAGALRVNADGVLCASGGEPLSPEIQVPADTSEIAIAPDGTVSVRGSRDVVPRPVGQLELCRFVNPAGLESIGGNLLAASAASGEPIVNTPGSDGMGSLVTSSLERSNVNLVSEMVNLILTQRAYEVNSKAVQASDEMLRMANNLRR